MKKILVILLTLATLLFPQTTNGQDDLTFEKAYADYVHNYDAYKRARNEYELARLNYLSDKTLSSKTKAQDAMLTMMVARDNVVITHLTALRKKLSDTSGFDNSEKESYFSQIDGDVSWHKSHRDGLPNAGSLENLVEESEKAKDKYEETTLILGYHTLGTVQIGKVITFTERLRKIISDINSKVGEIRLAGDKDTGRVERWLLDTEARITRSGQKKDEARKLLLGMDNDPESLGDDFGDFQELIIESNQFLKEAVSYIKEIIKEIKTAD